MKITHVSCVAPPEIGGIGKVAAQEVNSLQARGFDAHLISLSTHFSTRVGNAGRIVALDHLVRDADIVHLHYPFYGTAGLLACLRRKRIIKRLIMTLHMDSMADGIKGLLFQLHRKLFQDQILSAADQLIVSSLDYAENSSFKGFTGKAIELPFGIDERLYFSADELSSTVSRLPSILFVGGLDKAHAFKGVNVLLDAMTQVGQAKLKIVGDGDLRKDYETKAVKLGIKDRVEFFGKQPENALIKIYQSSSVLILPSVSGAEAFGLVALEAQACGVPVVASDLPGVRTVVAQNKTGFLVPPGNVSALAQAINKLLADSNLHKTMSINARQRIVDNYTWDKHMDSLIGFYKSIYF